MLKVKTPVGYLLVQELGIAGEKLNNPRVAIQLSPDGNLDGAIPVAIAEYKPELGTIQTEVYGDSLSYEPTVKEALKLKKGEK